jgi:hypothetical protein
VLGLVAPGTVEVVAATDRQHAGHRAFGGHHLTAPPARSAHQPTMVP